MPQGISFDYCFFRMDDDLERRKQDTLNIIAMYTYMMEVQAEDGLHDVARMVPFLQGKDPLEVITAFANVITGLLVDAGEGMEPLQRLAYALSR